MPHERTMRSLVFNVVSKVIKFNENLMRLLVLLIKYIHHAVDMGDSAQCCLSWKEVKSQYVIVSYY